MGIKFTVQAGDLNKALKVVSIVSPQAQASTQQERGYLFVAQGERCSVYSKNGGHEARSSFPITDVEGEGPFMYPADFISEFDFIKDEAVHFTAEENEGAFTVNYKFGDAGVDRVSFDPKIGMMSDLEKNIQKAMEGQEPQSYNIGMLQEALGVAKSFMATEKDKVAREHYKTVQIFGTDDPPDITDKGGIGYLYAANGVKACYFQTKPFEGRGLVMPGIHLGLLEKFMARSHGDLSVYKTERGYYVANSRDDVIGWPEHMDKHKKFAYYTWDQDSIVVRVEADDMRGQLQYMRATMPKDKTKIRLHYDVDANRFWFTHGGSGSRATSRPIPAEVETCKIEGEVGINLNVDYLLDLFSGVKGHKINFRILVMPPNDKRPKGTFMLRTIDEFLMDNGGEVVGGVVDPIPEGANVCRVTRYTSGMD